MDAKGRGYIPLLGLQSLLHQACVTIPGEATPEREARGSGSKPMLRFCTVGSDACQTPPPSSRKFVHNFVCDVFRMHMHSKDALPQKAAQV